jgi:hypothetical protein
MIEVLRKQWTYILYRAESNKYILSVVCGTVGLFDVDVELSADQVRKFENQGEPFIDELAAKIRYSPTKYINNNS